VTVSFYPEQEPTVQPPESLVAHEVRRDSRLRRARRARESARVLLLVLFAGWGIFALARDLIGLMAGGTHPPRVVAEPAPVALARCEGSLSAARAEAGRHPQDSAAWLRVASLELRRAELAALVAYETLYGPDWRHVWKPPPDAARWRARFLRSDPHGCLTRAAEAAKVALRQEREPTHRRQAFELLASARAGLDDPRGEAAALAGAAEAAPENAALWLRLAEAYGRTGQYARAERARARGLALVEDEDRTR
jgi:hypothetical protein